MHIAVCVGTNFWRMLNKTKVGGGRRGQEGVGGGTLQKDTNRYYKKQFKLNKMKTKQITKEKAKELILNNRSSIFSVLFTKKDGSKRSMNARLDVKSKLKDGKLRYNPSDFNYIIAYDMIKNNYRTINVNTLEKLRLNKKEYNIKI